MNKRSPIVSAIVSTHNAEKFLPGRLDNLLAQTIAAQLEIIVVVSGSEQRESLIVGEYKTHHDNIALITTEQRETIYRAWNRAIRVSSGRFITNANTDDRHKPDALETLAAALLSDPTASVAYGNQFLTRHPPNAAWDDSTFQRVRRPAYSHLRLLEGDVAGPQPLWRASLHWEEDLWFDERFEVAGDYEFFCRVAERHPFVHVPTYLGSCYSSSNRSNKEFQNLTVTAQETAEIQIRYIRQYIASLGRLHRAKLKRRVRRYLRMPPTLHVILYRMIHKLLPKVHFFSRAFATLLCGLLSVREGDRGFAIEICRSCEKLPRATSVRVLREQLEQGKA